ncbi:hypothetical protein A0128_03630 [Leptospira tipperaryensis]|uniref:Ketoreductase domain-containing protein n=1 Tax=Leptospira tipperaryensis TaxID=2564040 RepID=A0A1D7UTX8_9LEPT|nr:SDR family oxidoreductase [Leptospira tipperaryensis]AOP33031.1 hypothetical protein A0128_03630 [Leptospira tipperaryensis]
MNWNKKSVLITGSSRGIGRSLAIQLANRGTKLILASRTLKDLEIVKEECLLKGAETTISVCDVSREEDCKRTMEDVKENFGGLDVLILNAGIEVHGNFETLEISDLKKIVQINFLGPLLLTHYAIPYLNKGGRIVIVSSLQGKTGFPGSAVYSGSKHALHGFFDSLRMELAPRDIGVTIVCPGGVESDIRQGNHYDQKMLMPTSECARRIILAAEKEKREEIMTWKGKFGNVLRLFFPSLVDKMVENAVNKFYKK